MKYSWKTFSLSLLLTIFTVLTNSCGSEGASGTGSQTPEGSQPGSRIIPVTAETARITSFRNMPVYTGNIKPLYDISIVSRITARIEKIFRKPGDRVAAREVIALLEDDEQSNSLFEAEANYSLAQAQLSEKETAFKVAERELERTRSLYDSQFISDAQYETAQARYLAAVSALELARAQLTQREAALSTARLRKSYTMLSSPRPGLVGDLNFDQGSIISQNAVFTHVVVIDTVKCEIRVPDTVLLQLQKGMPAEVTRAVEGNENGHLFQGLIHSVSPVIDPQSRTASVQVLIPNPDHLLKPGMFARISIVLAEKDSVLAVPEKAITEYQNSRGVFSVIGDTLVTFVTVSTGLSDQGYVEIIPDRPLQKVVTEGQFMLKEGSRISLTPANQKDR